MRDLGSKHLSIGRLKVKECLLGALDQLVADGAIRSLFFADPHKLFVVHDLKEDLAALRKRLGVILRGHTEHGSQVLLAPVGPSEEDAVVASGKSRLVRVVGFDGASLRFIDNFTASEETLPLAAEYHDLARQLPPYRLCRATVFDGVIIALQPTAQTP